MLFLISSIGLIGAQTTSASPFLVCPPSSFTPTWNVLSPSKAPPLLDEASMAYDPISEKLILFGGLSNSIFLSQTWSWDGTTWKQLSPSESPPARSQASLALDPSSGSLILFGGVNLNGYLEDTWSWNGSTWVPEPTPVFPTARKGASMAADPVTQTLILFGGLDSTGYLNDTWSWDSIHTTWVPLSPTHSPSARYQASMGSDNVQLILFGGFNAMTGDFGDTWSWNGSIPTWVPLSPLSSPPARYQSPLEFDTATQQLILFGGHGASGFLADTWSFDETGPTWINLTTVPSPPPRQSASMAFFPQNDGQLILFGGLGNFGYLNDTWIWGFLPSVTSVTPNSGSELGGATVTILGANFCDTTVPTVHFGNNLASGVTFISPTELMATTPAGAEGIVDVTVTTSLGTSTQSPNDQFTYLPPPTVINVSPASGQLIGGTFVTITGTNFVEGLTISFGANPATQVALTSSTQATATSPAATNPGPVDITVTTPGGTSTTSPLDTFTYLPTPTVTSVSPNEGLQAGGEVITIKGTNFTQTPLPVVQFGPFVSTTVTFISSSELTAIAPSGEGIVDITVTTAGGTSVTSSNDQFTYLAVPSVSAIAPNAGPIAGGTVVTITGTNFSDSSTVKFGTIPATSVTFITSTKMMATAPAQIPGTVHVTVTTPGGTSTASPADQFTYLLAPTVSGISPDEGAQTGGDVVTITGTNFTAASTVNFGTSPAEAQFVSPTTIIATAPAGTGTVDVTVTTLGGTSATSSADQFTYLPFPTVTAISPSVGPVAGGTLVTITGTNFSGSPIVNFGSSPATLVTLISPTMITAQCPAGTGTVSITVTKHNETSVPSTASLFTYVPIPAVTNISPQIGSSAGGTFVTITGTNFTEFSSVNFGSSSATDVVVVSSTMITAMSPPGTGTVNVTVTTPGGTSIVSSADEFTYVPTPTLTAISPNAGPIGGGTVVTITGTNFTQTPPTIVNFGTVEATDVMYVSSVKLIATSPGGTGTVGVSVTTSNGTSAPVAFDLFTYLPFPTMIGISPNTGSPGGGTVVTITGTNFTNTSTVNFGATPATEVVFVSSNRILATSPPGTGTVDVTVTVPGGGNSSVILAGQFTYLPAPAVSSISPNAGPQIGGTFVTIVGTNFTEMSIVNFGTVPATDIVVDSSTKITAISPPGTGIVDVIVTTPSGSSTPTFNDQFTYLSPPTITGVSPKTGSTGGGTEVTITGTNFKGTPTVNFGSSSAKNIMVVSSTELTAVSPAGTGTVHITVTTIDGSSNTSPSDQFTYVSPILLPTVSGISPNNGSPAGGTVVTITGSNFIGTPTVNFGNSIATNIIVVSTTELLATSPAGMGTVDITVTTQQGTSSISPKDQFTYLEVEAPTVTEITPSTGPQMGGTAVTIIGNNFTETSTVKFGTSAATRIIVISSTEIKATSPAGTGSVHVNVTTLVGTSSPSPANLFTYMQAPPNKDIFPPEQVRGIQIENQFVMQTDIVNIITWKAPSRGVMPASYKIYRDAALTHLVGVIYDRNEDLFRFEDHHRERNRIYSYYIVSVDEEGVLSKANHVKISPLEK